MPEKTEQQIERDEQIYQLTTLVAGEFSLQEVLDKLAEAAVKIVGVKACSIRLLDEESGDLEMRSTFKSPASSSSSRIEQALTPTIFTAASASLSSTS